MNDIILKNVAKRFGERVVLDGFDLTIKSGAITCIMGPSGCGKTTLLNILGGLMKADSGSIENLPAKVAYVFQEDRLCEGFSAVSNIRLVTGKSVSEEKIVSALTELGLADSVHLPAGQLSGGMKRRVAIARAVLYDAGLILLDEPFKGLDGDMRLKTIDFVKRHTAGKTVVCVTHDPAEAEYFGGTTVKLDPIG